MKVTEKFIIQQRLAHIRENPCWLYVDIDDTLLIHDDRIEMEDSTRIKMKLLGKNYYFIENTYNVSTIKAMHKKGFVCIAWSAAGKKWATQAVTALKIKKYFTHILAKPMYFLDDSDPEKWIGKNLFRPHK